MRVPPLAAIQCRLLYFKELIGCVRAQFFLTFPPYSMCFNGVSMNSLDGNSDEDGQSSQRVLDFSSISVTHTKPAMLAIESSSCRHWKEVR